MYWDLCLKTKSYNQCTEVPDAIYSA